MFIELTCLVIAGGCALAKTLHRKGVEEDNLRYAGVNPDVLHVMKSPQRVAELITEREEVLPTYLTHSERRWIASQPGGPGILRMMAVRATIRTARAE